MGDIVGRRIIGAILRIRAGEPKCQLLLAFEDGTSYEFYSDHVFHPTAGLWPRGLEHTASYLRKNQLFCYEAVYDSTRDEVVERQYAGLADTKGDRVRHLKPPESWRPTLGDKARFSDFLRRCLPDVD